MTSSLGSRNKEKSVLKYSISLINNKFGHLLPDGVHLTIVSLVSEICTLLSYGFKKYDTPVYIPSCTQVLSTDTMDFQKVLNN